MTSVLLIDADVICYRVGFACQKNVFTLFDGGEPFHQAEGKKALNEFLKTNELTSEDFEIREELVVEPKESAFHSVQMMFNSLFEGTGVYRYIAYLTGSDNFRNEVYPAYKAGRKEKPVLYNEIREYLIQKYKAVLVHGMEADDMLGIEMMKNPERNIICTIDKDLDTIIGTHYNFVKKEKYFVQADQAEMFFYCQMLAGDSTDNVCGIRGVGLPTAKKRIEKSGLPPKEAAEKEYQLYWGDDWKEVWKCNEQLLRIKS